MVLSAAGQQRDGMALVVLQENPETEWFMWIDSDTMIINPTFNLPFAKFKGKDLVIWGNETALLAGNGRSGGQHSSSLAFPLFMLQWSYREMQSSCPLSPKGMNRQRCW